MLLQTKPANTKLSQCSIDLSSNDDRARTVNALRVRVGDDRRAESSPMKLQLAKLVRSTWKYQVFLRQTVLVRHKSLIHKLSSQGPVLQRASSPGKARPLIGAFAKDLHRAVILNLGDGSIFASLVTRRGPVAIARAILALKYLLLDRRRRLRISVGVSATILSVIPSVAMMCVSIYCDGSFQGSVTKLGFGMNGWERSKTGG